MNHRYHFSLALALISAASLGNAAASPEDAQGLWLTEQKDAIVEFRDCPDKPGALCGKIVWDVDAGKEKDTCGVRIAQLSRYENEAWRDGWIYDPRDEKKYKGTVRVKTDEMRIRAFVGTEILGQTERLSKVLAMPSAPACKS
ncbi:DUF2147 domain-containing protein [Variovorax sp. AFSI2.2]|uniref:DUF2147 domain-containing protein n=1 Tax=Variovorax sp. AFSI2.2 TaxID=3384160 RepID=UPI003EBB8119